MKSRENYVQLAVFCGVFILLSIAGIVSYETSGLLRGDPDGVLLLAICLLIGTIFSIQIVLVARSAGWLKFRQRYQVPASPVMTAASKETASQDEEETAMARK